MLPPVGKVRENANTQKEMCCTFSLNYDAQCLYSQVFKRTSRKRKITFIIKDLEVRLCFIRAVSFEMCLFNFIPLFLCQPLSDRTECALTLFQVRADLTSLNVTAVSLPFIFTFLRRHTVSSEVLSESLVLFRP